MQKLRVLDLFSGIGGFSLGLHWAGGFETVGFCEIEEYPRKVLELRFPGVPIFEDIRSLTGEQIKERCGAVNVVCGGYPCQPFSTAASGRNIAEKDLHGEFLRIVRTVRPRFAIAENVSKSAIELVSKELAKDAGFNAVVLCIPAHEIGAIHKRDRWWMVAYSDDKSEFQSRFNAKMAELRQVENGFWSKENYSRAVRVHDGVPRRVERLKCLGNAVVPQVVEVIGRAIMAAHHAK